MIGLNPLRTKVLITSDEVLFHAPTDKEADPRHILSHIILAERRFIKPMLGATLYNKLIEAKNDLVTADNKDALQTQLNAGRESRAGIPLVEGDIVNSDTYLTPAQQVLWKDYLWKIVAECVWFTAMPTNRARFGAQGIEVNNPNSIGGGGNSASIELKDLKHLMDVGLKSRIAPLMEDMHLWLCEKNFDGYDKDCGCSADGVRYTRTSPILFGMYDDDEGCGCRSRRPEIGNAGRLPW